MFIDGNIIFEFKCGSNGYKIKNEIESKFSNLSVKHIEHSAQLLPTPSYLPIAPISKQPRRLFNNFETNDRRIFSVFENCQR